MLKKQHWIGVLLLLSGLLAHGAEQPEKEKLQKQIDTLLSSHVTIDNIKQSPIPSLYEITAGAHIFYATADAHYIMYGHLVDMSKTPPLSLTEKAVMEARKKMMAIANPKDMIIYEAKGDPKSVLTVFMDVDCGYCRKLHQEVGALNTAGIEVRYLSFPRTGIGSKSYQTAEAVWCAKDPKKAMDEAMKGVNLVKAEGCDKTKVINQSLALVEALGLRGTPATILSDGRLLPGYIPSSQLIDLALSKNG